MTTVEVRAPAKINLTLHVTGRRDDGYHLLDSLVAFAPISDRLVIRNAAALSLTVEGPEAAGVPHDTSNLVLKVAERMAAERGASMTLTKHLPAAAGVGGGSADAAAAVRGLVALWGDAAAHETLLGDRPDPELFAAHWSWLTELGADLPMCLVPSQQRVTGIGDRIEYLQLPDLPAVLVNPRTPVATAEVFSRLTAPENPPMPAALPEFRTAAELIDFLRNQRNDLERPALEVAPIIGDALKALRATKDCRLARMSGSGATCFGLFHSAQAAQEAASQFKIDFPEWWVAAGSLGNRVAQGTPAVR